MLLARKATAVLNLKKTKRVARVDRFGRPIQTDGGDYYKAFHSVSSDAYKMSVGNKFATANPTNDLPSERSLKGGHGIKYALTILLSLGFAYNVYAFPHYIPYFYCSTIIPFFLFRFATYYSMQRHHFCLEVCYFLNYGLLTYILILPDNYLLFMGLFSLTFSVAIGSSVILSFKFVFSDIQTYINMYMHVAPSVTVLTIRFLIPEDETSLIDFDVCRSTFTTTGCTEQETFFKSLMYFLVYPLAAYTAHMILYNFWVWVVPHPKLHARKTYLNTFVKLMSGGFGSRMVRLASMCGKKYALWVYSIGQIFLFGIFMVAVAPLYYTKIGSIIYVSVLVVSMLFNGGQYYSYKLRKLEAVEKKLEIYDGAPEEEPGYAFDGEEKKEERAERRPKSYSSSSRREMTTVIRTVDAFALRGTGGGQTREHRSKMASTSAGRRKVQVHDEVRDIDTEESVGVLARQRREGMRDGLGRSGVF
jgi:hypothetical protein